MKYIVSEEPPRSFSESACPLSSASCNTSRSSMTSHSNNALPTVFSVATAEWPSLIRVTIERMKGGAVPSEIATEAGELISELRTVGWTVQTSQFDARLFGNWLVDLRRGGRTLRLVKDRSQFMVAGPPTQAMKDVGLWRAFDSF